MDKKSISSDLIDIKKKLALQKQELIIAKKKLTLQNKEKKIERMN